MILGLAAAGFVLATPAAWGQTSPDAALPPVGPDPALTTATYGDWTLRCQSVTITGSQTRICEVVQIMRVEGRPEPVAQVAFGKAAGERDLHVVAALPVDISFPSRVALILDQTGIAPTELAWKRCIPGACFAETVAGSATIEHWRAATAPGRVQFTNASNRDVALPLSFRGLAPALDALNKMQ